MRDLCLGLVVSWSGKRRSLDQPKASVVERLLASDRMSSASSEGGQVKRSGVGVITEGGGE